MGGVSSSSCFQSRRFSPPSLSELPSRWVGTGSAPAQQRADFGRTPPLTAEREGSSPVSGADALQWLSNNTQKEASQLGASLEGSLSRKANSCACALSPCAGAGSAVGGDGAQPGVSLRLPPQNPASRSSPPPPRPRASSSQPPPCWLQWAGGAPPTLGRRIPAQAGPSSLPGPAEAAGQLQATWAQLTPVSLEHGGGAAEAGSGRAGLLVDPPEALP